MALTIADVTHPNSQSTAFPFGPFKAVVKTITFDSSYLTTGEVLNASDLGWNQVHGAIAISGVGNADGTLSLGTVVRANTAKTALAFQAQETAGTVDTPHKELTSATDISAYYGTFLIFGT